MDALTTTTAMRRFPRRAVSEAVHLAPADGAKKLAVLVDISRGGALVLSGTRFEPGDAVDLTVYPDLQGRGAVVVRGRVVWSQRRAGEVLWPFAAGIELEELLAESLVADLSRGEGLPSCDAFPVEVAAATGATAAIAHDLSSSGAMILSRSRLSPGQRLRLTLCCDELLPGASGEPMDCTVVRVERCEEEDSMWRFAVGVRFDRAIGSEPVSRRAA